MVRRAMAVEELADPVMFRSAGIRMSLPVAAALIFAATRVLCLALAALLIGHGRFAQQHWSLSQWITSWDAKFYLTLATRGYSFHWPHPLPHGSLYPWFPGYPAAIAAVDRIPAISAAAAGFIVTTVAGLIAAWGLARLGMQLTGDRRVSLLMVALWGSAPGSIVFSMVYPEALYCALAIWALVALTDGRWLTAAALTVAAGTTASYAVALIMAYAVAALVSVTQAVRAGQRIITCWRPLAGLAIAPLGLLGYWGLVARWTHRLDGWFWIEHAAWYQTFDWGESTVQNLERTILGWSSLPTTLLMLVIVVAVLLTAWTLTEPLPVHLRAYVLVTVFLAIGTTAQWLCCKPRFLLPAVLLTLPTARLLSRLRTPLLVPLLAIGTCASTWLGLYLAIIARLPP